MSQAFGNDAKSHEQIDHHVQKEAQSPDRLMVLKKIKFLNWNQFKLFVLQNDFRLTKQT